jgi:hypothetical protein
MELDLIATENALVAANLRKAIKAAQAKPCDVNVAGALLMKGDVAGHEFHGNQFSEGQGVRFEGNSADGKVSGGMDVKVINPHSNASLVVRTEGTGKHARQYDAQGHQHIPTATVERPARTGSFPTPAKQFEAFHHTLYAIK